MPRWFVLRCQCTTAMRTLRATRQLHLPGKWRLMLSRLFPGDPGEFMRNRYFIALATALMAVFLIVATGCKGNPEKAKTKYLESGLSYVDKKQYDAAVIQFKKALQVDPKYAEAHYQLGLAYLHQGNDKQHVVSGYQELHQATELDPNNLKAKLAMGNLLFGAFGKYKLA